MSKADDSAFPASDHVEGVGACVREYGLTKLEWFAGMALQGLLSGSPDMLPNIAAEDACAHAEEILDRLAMVDQ